jgi:hypothetical protein
MAHMLAAIKCTRLLLVWHMGYNRSLPSQDFSPLLVSVQACMRMSATANWLLLVPCMVLIPTLSTRVHCTQLHTAGPMLLSTQLTK